jgi:lipid A ethanolaminephosphotransferase
VITLVALWITATANGAFFHALSGFTPYNGLHAAIFLTATFMVLWAYLSVVLQLLGWGLLTRPLLSFFLVASALTSYCIDSFGVGIDQGQIQNLVETDVREVGDMMNGHFAWRLMWAAVLPLMWLWWRPLTTQPWTKRLRSKGLAVLSSVALIGAMVLVFYVDYAAVFREHRTLRDLVTPHNSIGGLIRYWNRHAKLKPLPLVPYGVDAHRSLKVSTQPHVPTLLVLVVGETARGESFGLGGYARNTTPELAAQRVTYFSQTASCGTATAVSVPCMFSGMTRHQYDADLAKHREGLLDILKRAGYAVTWIDNNSGCKGACDRVEQVTPLATKRAAWCEGNECLDGILDDTVADFLAHAPVQDRVLVLHQAGSHGPAYYKRYSPAFKRFTPTCDTNAIQGCPRAALINTYDNSIAYTDHILASLIQQLQAQETRYQSVMWYVSDHGESTGEHGLYLHGAPYLFAPSQQTHVPMLTWLSPRFQAQRPALLGCLTAKKDQATSQDHLFHTILGLLSVETEVKDATLDLTAGCV